MSDPPVRRLSDRTELPDSLLAPSAARRWVAATLSSWAVHPCQDVQATIAALTSELVTNAVRHAAPGATGDRALTITLVVEDHVARIEVHDHDPALPSPRDPDLISESGRGLLLVEALAHHWGAVPYENGKYGKYVWFSVECRNEPGRANAVPPGDVSAVSLPVPPNPPIPPIPPIPPKENPVCRPSPSPTTSSVPEPTM